MMYFPNIENDLDGEALAAAVSIGPESLKEAIPSFSRRLKLIGAIKFLKSSLCVESGESLGAPGSTVSCEL